MLRRLRSLLLELGGHGKLNRSPGNSEAQLICERKSFQRILGVTERQLEDTRFARGAQEHNVAEVSQKGAPLHRWVEKVGTSESPEEHAG